MRHVTITVTIVAIVIAALALAGCGGYVSKTPTMYAQIEKNVHTFADLAAVAEKIRDGQPVEGAVYLRESYPDIAAVTEVAERWFKAVRDVDYRTYDKTAWLVDLTAERRNLPATRNDVEETAKAIKNGKVVTKDNGFEPSVVVFGPGYQSAIVLGSDSFTIVDATEAYLTSRRAKRGEYTQKVKLEMRKIGDVWQIDGYELDAADRK